MESKEITIPANGYKLAATFVTPDNTSEKHKAVIFFHGLPSKRKPRYIKRAEALAKVGIAALTFDFRGCGESEGEFGKLSIADWFADALATYDYLAQQPFIDPNRIGVSGKSFGGYIGALITEKRPVSSMVLHAPAVFPDDWIKKPFAYNNKTKQARLDYRNSTDAFNNKAIAAIKHYTNPLLIIGSELDTICPKHVVEGFYTNALSKQKQIKWIKNADHMLHNEDQNNLYTTMMVEWFKKTF